MKFLPAILLFLSLAFLSGSIASAQRAALINDDQAQPDRIHVNNGGGKLGGFEVIEVDQQPFDKALRVSLTSQPSNTWDASLSAKTTSAVKKGDVIGVSFWLRGKRNTGVGGGVAEFVFEKSGAPYTKSIQYLAESPTDGRWRQYSVRFRSLEDYPAGGAHVAFQIGYLKQTVELGGLEAWNYGSDVDYDSIPHTALTYVGRELDADWRKAADDRIEKLRKQDISHTVRDANGQPIKNQSVQVKLVQHQFGFGTAVSTKMIMGEGEDNDRYRQTLKQHFNLATIENGLKWKQWDSYLEIRDRAVAALDWLHENGVDARGHVMVWPGKRYLPDFVISLLDQPEILSKVIDTHIREVGFAARGKVRDWDVLNEVFDNQDLTTVLGDEAMVHWFKQADAVAPDCDLYYNDYAGLVRGGFPTGHKTHFEKTIRYLLDNNAPIDGIGIQGHFGSLVTPPERLLAELDRWHALGLKVLITEFDVEVPSEELKGDFTRDFLTVCFSHPGVAGVVTWGFWEGAQWKPEAAFFKKDWTPTAMGNCLIDLTKNKWTTEMTLTTNGQGQIQFRGFKGKYEVVAGGETTHFETTEGSANSPE